MSVAEITYRSAEIAYRAAMVADNAVCDDSFDDEDSVAYDAAYDCARSGWNARDAAYAAATAARDAAEIPDGTDPDDIREINRRAFLMAKAANRAAEACIDETDYYLDK
jgi:hypothetical protein